MAEAATEMLFGGIPLMGKGIVNKIGGKIGFELLSEPTKQQIRTFRNTIGGRVAKQVTERLGGTLGEGTEEAIMAVAQPYIETNVAGVESDVSIEDIIHDFGMGAAVSLILGMPVNAVNDTMIAYDAVQQRRQNKDFIKAAEERVNELVNEGQMTEEDAAASVREVRDILSGKGSLRVSDEAGYEEKTTSDTRRIYDSAEEAEDSAKKELEGKDIGTEIKAAYFDGENVREYTARKTEAGVKYLSSDTTEGDFETYRAKAEKVRSAQNEAERSGYQLNVKEDLIREVSNLSKAMGRDIVFEDVAKKYNADGSVDVTRGWFGEDDGKIHVNVRNETPAATVIAHEITHSMETTKAYKEMQKAVFDYYKNSIGAERQELEALYAEGGKTLDKPEKVDSEVIAKFVETKLLTDKETINYIVKRNKTFGERIVNGINRIIQRKIGSKEQKFLAGVRTKWEAALEESRKEGDKKRPSGDGKVAYAFEGYAKDGRGMYTGAFKVGTPKSDKAITIKDLVQNVWHKEPIPLVIKEGDHSRKIIWAKFDPSYDEEGNEQSDLTKLMGGNRHGTASDQRVTLNLAEDYPKLLKEARYNGHKKEEGKTSLPHQNVDEWYYFINDIYYAEKGSEKYEPYRVSINVKHTFKGKKGYWVYSYSAEKQKGISAPQTLHAAVKDEEDFFIPNADSSINSIPDSVEKDNRKYSFGKEKDREYMAAVESGDMGAAQRMVDQAAKAAGYTERLYHQTNAEFTVFETRHKGAGSRDNETPYGIFMKTSSANIGLKGNKQMELYAKIQNPLVAYDRRFLRKMIESMSPEYRNLKEEIKNIDKDYGEKYKNARTGWQNYVTEWRKNNPDAKRTALDDDPEFKRLFDETKRIIDEWTEKASNLDEKAKEEITRTLTDSGYDGIILSRDEGSFGRSTDAYIALDPSQVKSADPVTYDDKGNVIPLSERFDAKDADIRYSYARENPKVSAEMGELVKAYNAEMRGVFYNRSPKDNRELWDMIHEEMVHILKTGAMRNEKVRDIIDFAYETGYRMEDQEPPAENTWGGGIYVPKEYRGEMETLGGLQAVNRKMMGTGIYFTYKKKRKGTNESYGGIDEAYNELRSANPMMEETSDPGEQVASIVDYFSSVNQKQTLKDLDAEIYDLDFVEPYKKDITETVERAFDDIATLARADMMKKARQEGEKEGIQKGMEQEKEEQKKQEKKKVDAQRKADEATMRMHDRLVEEVQNEADKKYAAEEKRKEKARQKQDAETLKVHDRLMREKDREKKKEVQKELKKQAKEFKDSQKAERKSYEDVIKDQDKQKKKMAKKLTQQERQKKKARELKNDRDRRDERIKVAMQEARRRKEPPKPGTAKAMYQNNKSAVKLANEFRTEVISSLVEQNLFKETNGHVVIDNNGMEVAFLRTTDGMWEFSTKKNEYTPYWGLVALAEKEGIDAAAFYTMYSKIVRLRKDPNIDGAHRKKQIVKYIESLNLTVKQKMFLYFDAAKYAYSTRPGTGSTKAFTNGGKVEESKGNIRGRIFKYLDDITFDMFNAAKLEPTLLQSEKSRQIRQEDITGFVDAVFGEESSEGKDQFSAYFMGLVTDYASQMETARMVMKSNLLTEKPTEKDSLRMNIVRSYRQAKRLFIAEGEAFERMSDKLKDPLYAASYYAAKKSGAIANEMIYGKGQRGLSGEKQGKSLYDIFKPIFKADEKAKSSENVRLLTLFVNCRHDIYRLMNDKGYTGYTIEECEEIIAKISEEHPEIEKAGDELVEYSRNLLRMCVESGRLSEEEFQYYTLKYPYYVPAFRLVENEYYDREGNVIRRDKDIIRKAKGGTSPEVLPLFDQLVNKTHEIVKTCKKNQLAGRLANAYRLGATEYIEDVIPSKPEKKDKTQEEETQVDKIDSIGEEEKNVKNIIPWYSNGVKYDIVVADDSILYGWDKISRKQNEADFLKALRKFNSLRRGVLTQYNPTFWLTNGIKDLQDLFIYNQHAERLPKFYALAVKTMFAGKATGLKRGIDKKRGKETEEERKNEQLLQEYLSYGMSETSIFEYDDTRSGRRTKRKRISGALKKPLDLFDGLNFAVEQTPRFAVYLETVDRLTRERDKGRNEYTDEDIKTIAVYKASDATLNFGRSGTVVKNLNTYGCTFLNAGVQGLDRFRRMFTQVKDGNKRAIIFNVIGLGVKLGLIGLTPGILSDILYGDDDDEGWKKAVREFLYGDDAEKIAQEYAEMADYQKENYFLFNIGGKWIRIPKGRVLAFIQSFKVNGTKVHEKEMDALDLVIAQLDMASETIMFSNPVTSNIFGPMIEVWNNKDHWGNEIVSEYEDMGEGFHYLEYDEETSKLAIKIAEFGHYLTADVMGREESRLLDFSPKKLDHLIQQYLGSYSNLIVPFLSGNETMSEKAMDAWMSLVKKFYVDPTTSNRLAGDYYDMKEKYENISNAHDGDTPYAVVDYVFKDYNEQLKVKREEISAINANENLTREEKLKKISALKAEMNELYRQGIADAESLLSYAHANYYGKEGNRELYEGWLDLNKDADWKLSTMSDSAQAMYNEISSTGVTTENFVNAYNFFGNLTSDKDENGKIIRGSKQDKFVNYLNSLPATAEQKVEMFYTIGGYSRNKEAPEFADGEYKQPVLTEMSSPLASGGRISSGYGWRTCPFDGREFHAAVDIAAPAGTDVGAVLSGKVTMATYSNSFGYTVEVTSVDKNGNVIVAKYNHMSELGVTVNDIIGQGVQVGKVGSTGQSTGPHLDFRLKINGEWVDPEQYLDLTAAGIVDSTGYSAKEASGGTASGGYSSASSGGSSGGSKSGGSSGRTASGSRRTSGSYTASTGGRRSSGGSGSSGGSSGGVTLPTASQASAITGRSTKAATYSRGGVTLPTAKDLARSRGTTIAANKSGTGTPRTGTTAGTRFWDENVLG